MISSSDSAAAACERHRAGSYCPETSRVAARTICAQMRGASTALDRVGGWRAGRGTPPRHFGASHAPALPPPPHQEPHLGRHPPHRARPGRGSWPATPRECSWSTGPARAEPTPSPLPTPDGRPGTTARHTPRTGTVTAGPPDTEMITLGAGGCAAFLRGASPGTAATIRLAKAAGIPVWLHTQSGPGSRAATRAATPMHYVG